MANKIVKDQYYVPRTYLKHFVFPKAKKIWTCANREKAYIQ